MEEYGSPRWVVPPVALELGADESFDVLEEDPARSNRLNCSEDVGEQVSWVVVGVSIASGRKRLTGETTSDDVHPLSK